MKIQSKLPLWKGKLLFYGDRLILVNSVLSSIPLYYFSYYKVPLWVIKRIDKIRQDFLWENSENVHKIPLIKWDAICLKKEFGGLGILNLNQMNIALLGKWIWNYYNDSKRSKWKDILKFKYKRKLQGNVSYFWKGVISILPTINRGLRKIVMSGNNTLFWNDLWFENLPFKIRFPLTYAKSKYPDKILVEKYGQW